MTGAERGVIERRDAFVANEIFRSGSSADSNRMKFW